MTRLNKLECLYLAITFQSSLTFAGSTRSLPKTEACVRSSNFGLFWPCSQILRPDWKGFPSSLLGLIISDEGKKFYNIGTRIPASTMWLIVGNLFLTGRQMTLRASMKPRFKYLAIVLHHLKHFTLVTNISGAIFRTLQSCRTSQMGPIS